MPRIPKARYPTPRRHGDVLVVPPLTDAAAMVERNRALMQSWSASWPDADLEKLRDQARADVLAALRLWMEQHDLPACAGESAGIILTGHQPELFHPGVWIKNFATTRLARRLCLTPIHLIVDNDLARRATVDVPRWSSATVVAVPLDRWEAALPYEEWLVNDEEYFAFFAERALAVMGNAGFTPMLASFWAEVCRARSNRVGERLAIARHRIERRWGFGGGELPVSRLAETPAFLGFIHHLLSRLPQFHQSHNACLNAYRAGRGIRSRSHPVAELGTDADWIEAPFWAWRAGERRRTRPFYRQSGSRRHLRLGQEVFELPPLGVAAPPLAVGSEAGWKLRPRAVTTTLFCRLFVADLFIHGIGGAVYDELTDALIRDFYGINPPEYLVLSATLQLPFAAASEPRQIEAILRRLRDLHWNPDRYLSAAADLPEWATRLAAEKRKLMDSCPHQRDERRRRFHRFREINECLQPLLAGIREKTQRQYQEAAEAVARHQLAARRDFAFALYPEEMLRQFFSLAVSEI